MSLMKGNLGDIRRNYGQNLPFLRDRENPEHYIIFNNLRTFKDEHFKLTGDLDWHVPYQLDEFYNFSCTITSRFPSSCKGTNETKSHINSMY